MWFAPASSSAVTAFNDSGASQEVCEGSRELAHVLVVLQAQLLQRDDRPSQRILVWGC